MSADPQALRLLGRLLAFDPKDRPIAEEVDSQKQFLLSWNCFTISQSTYINIYALICYIYFAFLILLQALVDTCFASLTNAEREPSRHPISKLEFEFERQKLTKDDVRELIYREVERNSLGFLFLFNNILVSIENGLFMKIKQILEYRPQILQEYMKGGEQISFLYPRCRLALIFPAFLGFCVYHVNGEDQPIFFPNRFAIQVVLFISSHLLFVFGKQLVFQNDCAFRQYCFCY